MRWIHQRVLVRREVLPILYLLVHFHLLYPIAQLVVSCIRLPPMPTALVPIWLNGQMMTRLGVQLGGRVGLADVGHVGKRRVVVGWLANGGNGPEVV